MPPERASSPKQADSLPFAAMEWWKPQAVALQSLHGEALPLAEAQLRKQADRLHERAGSQDFSEVLKTQINFLQAFWADSKGGVLTAFASLRRDAGAEG
ncbi:hypothetical protein SAMN05216304_1104 [Bosea sp. OK403]|nr:hypothetical protein SAMN05216304_1104 [Bosea sp. OK403]